MKRSFLYILPGLMLGYTATAQGIKVMPGTSLKFTGMPYTVVLAGGAHLENNTAVDGSNLILKASGAGTSELKGSGSLSVNRLLVNKVGGQQIALLKSINVTDGVVFTSGLLNLNGNDLLLADTAALFSESETSHFAPSAGAVQITCNLNAPLAENPGNLGLVITSGADWGTTVIRRSSQPYSSGGGGSSIGRSYSVSPANNTGLSTFLRMYYLDAELNGLNESQLDFYRSDNNAVNWTNIGSASRNTMQNFVNINGLQTMSLLTLSTTSNPLPLQLTRIAIACLQQRVQLQWQVANPWETAYFRIEKSPDGAAWNSVADHIPAQAGAGHQYVYTDTKEPERYYRLLSVNRDGNVSYAPVQEAACAGALPAFVLLQNPVRQMAVIGLQTDVVVEGSWQLVDMQGRIVLSQPFYHPGGSAKAQINLAALASGIYQLRMAGSAGILWQTKLVKQ